LEQAGLFTDVLKLYEPEASTEKTSEDRRAIMGKHGLVESQAVQQKQSNYADYGQEIYDNNSNINKNIDRGFKFLHGFGKGALLNTTITAACNTPIVGPYLGVGLLTLGAGILYVNVSSKLAKFNQDNFIFSDDYEDIMRNPLISDEQKQQISQDAHARYEQVEQQRYNSAEPEGILANVKNMWEQHPEELGSSVGVFFSFGRPGPIGSGVCASSVIPVKPNLPFKLGWNKQQHSSILEKNFRIQPGKEHCDFATGYGGAHGYENFANARAAAKFRANLGDDAVPFLQEIGPYRNNVYTGMQSLNGHRGWRLDFNPKDSNIGGHINWWHQSETGRIYKGMIKIDQMDNNLYWDILSHFPKNLPII
jgi:hypothetical protein